MGIYGGVFTPTESAAIVVLYSLVPVSYTHLLRVNEQYCALTGTSAVELEEQRKFILKDTREEDREHAFGIFTQAYENPLKGAEGDLRRRKGDGTYMWMHLRVFFLREQMCIRDRIRPI